MARFNVAELYIGIAASVHPKTEEAVVRGLVADLGILEFDDKAARMFGQITAHLQKLGRPAGNYGCVNCSNRNDSRT